MLCIVNVIFPGYFHIVTAPNEKGVIEDAQNVYSDSPRACAVSSGYSVSVDTVHTEFPMILYVDSEGPDQTAQADLGLRCPHML